MPDLRVKRAGSRDGLPDDPLDWLARLGGPTWIELKGRDPSRRRAVVTLLHGNEPSGLRAVHRYLKSGRVPAVTTHFFLASVAAALEPPPFSHRMRPGDPDVNRCFGPHRQVEGDHVQAQLADDTLRYLQSLDAEAVVDLHNSTGRTPSFAIAFVADHTTRALATLFTERLVVFDRPMGTLVEALTGRCRAVAVECGRAHSEQADACARAGLLRFLETAELVDRIAQARRPKLLHNPRAVRLRQGLSLSIDRSPRPEVDVTLNAAFEQYNFREAPIGTTVAWLRSADLRALEIALEPRAVQSTASPIPKWFRLRGTELRTVAPLIPLLFTCDANAARTDCLFYAVRAAAR